MNMAQNAQINCPQNCSFKIAAHIQGLWECPKCHQIWDRYERGTRLWMKDQQIIHRALWAQALSSGEYQQGKEYLRWTHPDLGTDHYTSTGVAVDTCPFTSWSKGPANSHAATSGDDHPNFLVPTLTVMNWLGLSSPQGHFKDLPEHPSLVGQKLAQNNLVYLNDRLSVDFPTIASIIESNPTGMFL